MLKNKYEEWCFVMSDFESKLLEYLRTNVATGKIFFKSKYIAKDIGDGATPKQIGAFLFKLSKNANITGISISPWSSSISTTWRIMPV